MKYNNNNNVNSLRIFRKFHHWTFDNEWEYPGNWWPTWLKSLLPSVWSLPHLGNFPKFTICNILWWTVFSLFPWKFQWVLYKLQIEILLNFVLFHHCSQLLVCESRAKHLVIHSIGHVVQDFSSVQYLKRITSSRIITQCTLWILQWTHWSTKKKKWKSV